ncbi:CDP-glycerol glycerophosphotransferase family protein [Metabacillus rhizolycopersici]|uniref:CDP-glycerol glycerophosphotransferase family protein n=1 Tax=Metabacillus rhizolycopersici TaxID=2875709 RepID=A0ABS7UV93_9BACI|nr:CDP-glycerol glycerophosphotransferase family protein [Metabacillus rhizolycopersici]MBZ5751977.1 CDP-glycerol glycerophosphotransferase family protein [Metabacillus rhizolycopersici]
MQQKNKIIWLFTLEFLEIFSNIYYDLMPISIPLLRDFQKYVERQYHVAYLEKKNTKLNLNIQKACDPYLINNNHYKKTGEYLLVRSDLYSLTSTLKKKCIYLAHHQNEYKKMFRNKQCRPLYFLHDLPEKNMPISDEKQVTSQLNQIFRNQNIPAFFKNNSFITWMNKEVKKLLVVIRKVHTLFDKYSISKTLYGSTINRHGALITTFAQSRNIETINFQHGILGELGHLPLNADLHLVWGKSHEEYLKTYGAPSEKMKIAPPHFPKSAKIAYIKKSPKGDYFLKTNVPFNQINILVALQPLAESFNKKMIQNIEAAANKFSGKLFIHYKLHPDQSSRSYKNLVTSTNSKLYTHGTVSLQDLIDKSALIITPFSTVSYEALLAQKPVAFYSKPRNIYYLQGKPSFIFSLDEIYKLFSNIIYNQTFLFKLFSQVSIKDEICLDKTLNPSLLEKILN